SPAIEGTTRRRPMETMERIAGIGMLLIGSLAGCAVEAGGSPEDTGSLQQASTSGYTFTRLCLYAHHDGSAGSGTSDDVVLQVHPNDTNQVWECTLAGGIDAGETRCCIPKYVNDTTGYDADVMTVRFHDSSSTDGLRISTVSGTRTYVDGSTSTLTVENFDEIP